MKNKLAFLFLFCLALTPVLAADLVKLPAPQGFVNDYAGVLTAAEKQQLLTITDELKRKNGSELGIAIVSTVAPLTPKMYATELFNKWGIGQKGKDNGVLILLAMAERRVEIEVGYGLEGVLNDATCGRILDVYAIPFFKEGKMGQGIVQTAQAIAQLAAKEEIKWETPSRWTEGYLTTYLFLWLIAIVSLAAGIVLLVKNVFFLPPVLITIGISLGAYLLGDLSGDRDLSWILPLIFGLNTFIITLALNSALTGRGGGGGGGYSSGGGSSSGSSSSSSHSSSGSSSSGSSSGRYGGGSSGGGGSGRSW